MLPCPSPARLIRSLLGSWQWPWQCSWFIATPCSHVISGVLLPVLRRVAIAISAPSQTSRNYLVDYYDCIIISHTEVALVDQGILHSAASPPNPPDPAQPLLRAPRSPILPNLPPGYSSPGLPRLPTMPLSLCGSSKVRLTIPNLEMDSSSYVGRLEGLLG
jgi:hypothetical protein